MALNAYVSAVQTLLHDPNAQFYSVATLTGFINAARQQIALEGECIRGQGTISTVPTQQLYQNTDVASPATPPGIASPGLIVPRSISYSQGTNPNGGLLTLEGRNWDWFNFYWLGMAAPPPGIPAAWSPFTIGSDGSFYIGPRPVSAVQLIIDGAWSPINLASDSDPEAIPYPWTDAVQFYALFLAYTDSQRSQDAEEAFGTYETFMGRARGIVTPARVERTYPGGGSARRVPGQAPPSPPRSTGAAG